MSIEKKFSDMKTKQYLSILSFTDLDLYFFQLFQDEHQWVFSFGSYALFSSLQKGVEISQFSIMPNFQDSFMSLSYIASIYSIS